MLPQKPYIHLYFCKKKKKKITLNIALYISVNRQWRGACIILHQNFEIEFKEQLVTIIGVSPSSSTVWVFFMLHYSVCLFAWSASVSVCVVVYVCVCVRAHRLHVIRHSSTFGNITPAASSLKVVNEHRDTVGSHQVVGVSGERLVLPAFWITWGQTDGGQGGWY